MSIEFDLAVLDPTPRRARINARQLARFRRFLDEHGEPNGADHLGYDFEARICRFPLAQVSSVFDHDPDVLGVLEEAQFRGLRTHIYRHVEGAQARLMIGLSAGADAARPLRASSGAARSMLQALGETVETGSMELDDLRRRLSDATCRVRLHAVDPAFLAAMDGFAAASVSDPETQLVWA